MQFLCSFLRNPWIFGLAMVVMLPFSCARNGDPNTETILLKNDGYSPGQARVFQGGFVTDDGAGVTLGPVSKAFVLQRVHFLFGGSGTQTAYGRIRVYEDNNTSIPGTMVHQSNFSITASDDNMVDVNLSDYNLSFPAGSSFRVVIVMNNDAYPSVAADVDGSNSEFRNWIYSFGNWHTSKSLGLKGDWIIRATIETDI